MTEALDRTLAWMLTGMTHARAKDLPQEAQEILEASGGTFVIWKDERPLAVLVILPSVPTFGAPALKRLARQLLAKESPTERKKPRRRRS